MKVIHFHVCSATTIIFSISLRKNSSPMWHIYGCANYDICNLSLRVQMMFTMHLENSEEHRKNKEERSHVKRNNIGNTAGITRIVIAMGAQRGKKGRRITPGTHSTHSTYTTFLKKKEEHPISRATSKLWIFDIWSRRGEKVQNNNTRRIPQTALSTNCKINPKGHGMTKEEQRLDPISGAAISNPLDTGYWPQDRWQKRKKGRRIKSQKEQHQGFQRGPPP